ncbi:MAG: molybdopterin-binding protein [Anaerolineae bacterium]|nr:molybdopterin-binding protein [Anaerolineales bacterium]MCQ3972589.1 molybdopterin-binding protein [Anaerolineae bacterium]
MKVAQVPLAQAVGHILLHHQAGPDGRKALKKGQRLTPADISLLQELGREQVFVAILDHDDLDENEAARRLGQAMLSHGLAASSATTGRVNLIATINGLLKVNVENLLTFNDIPGITLATLPANTTVQPKTMVGTLKIIPYGVPQTSVAAAEARAIDSQLVTVKPFVVSRAVLITTGSAEAREKVVEGFTPALRDRLAGYNTELIAGPYVPEDEAEIGEALQWALGSGAQMILIAGETSIMDEDDITPRAIKAVGGEITHYGMPVEPGNLMLLAYRGNVPIVGAPGCAKSKSYNVVDMVLPRLAAGERLTRRDLVALGHGGLLK